MSDSFADLWSSSAPLPPKPKPQTLSSASSSSTSAGGFARQNSNSSAGYGSKPDLFALLSAPSSGASTPRYGANPTSTSNLSANGMGTAGRPSNPPSRTMTPSSSSSLSLPMGMGVKRTGSAAGASSTSTSNANAGGAGDAFSDLFSASTSSGNPKNGSSNMTLAARLAMERAGGIGGGGRTASAGSIHAKPAAGGGGGGAGLDDAAAWAGLDSLAGGSGAGAGLGFGAAAKVEMNDDDDWGLGDFGSAAAATSASRSGAGTGAGAGSGSGSKTRPRPRTQTTAQSIAAAAAAASSQQKEKERKAPVSLWDLDDFKEPASSSSPPAYSSAPPARMTYSPSPSTAGGAGQPPNSSKPLFFDNDDDVGVSSPDRDFDFGGREDFGVGGGSKERERERQGGRGRGLLDLDGSDGDEDGFGFGGTLGNGNGNGRAAGHAGGGAGEDEDDILGMLSKPVEVVRARVGAEDRPRQPPRPTSANTPTNKTQPRINTASPPPHVVGQLVEMGFSVSQAKKALSATRDGIDVQAALESLLGGAAGGPSEESAPAPAPQREPVAPRARGPPKGQKERERERLEKQRFAAAAASSSSRDAGPASSSSTITTDNITEQADKLLAQASEIGLSVFSKASAFWREGKERVVKAYEEREREGGLAPGARARGSGGRGGGGGGKPRWMMEGAVDADVDQEEEGGERRGKGRGTGRGGPTAREKTSNNFRDGWESPDEDEQLGGEVHDASVHVHVEEEVDLFAANVPPAAKSQSQSQPKAPLPSSLSSFASEATSSRANMRTCTPVPRRTATPIQAPAPIPTRTLIPASPSALAAARKHKTLGTEQFKLGQFAAAAEAYTLALQALPAGHLLRVPLLTNRAAARMKVGEYAGVVQDCEGAVWGVVGRDAQGADGGNGDVGGDFGVEDPLADKPSKQQQTAPALVHPSSIPPALLAAGRAKANESGWTHPEGLGVDLLEHYAKALRRAAEACEGRERWADAGVWWGVLSRAAEGAQGWVDEGARREAIKGGVRCRKMVEGESGAAGAGAATSGGSSAAPSRAAPRRTPSKPAVPSSSLSSSAVTTPSRALQALQSSTAQAEADDALKHTLKDSVDARIAAWKAGKEANIRALLASLESVLWEGAGGMQGLGKMGMADLVSGAQVKKGYVRAIGRVHPDKLNAGNSTLEQRMLANGIFGGLNEAWIAFQATQK